MNKITIWHNPNCSKSRATLNLLNDRGIQSSVVKYLDTPPTKDEITDLLQMLNISPRELMRTKEDIYKELNLKDETDENRLIEAMAQNPKLIERPIVIKDGKAAIGRPIENIIELLEA